MAYFEKRMQGQFSALLETRENQCAQGLRQSLEQSLQAGANPDREASDTKDAAFTSAGLDISQAHDDMLAAGLGDVQAARQRLDKGDFGFCVKCGAQIDLARLLAVPETPRCTQCQEAFEKHSLRVP